MSESHEKSPTNFNVLNTIFNESIDANLLVMNRYGILNSVSVSVFSGRNTEVSVSVSVLKSV